jgi:hypothetical protein
MITAAYVLWRAGLSIHSIVVNANRPPVGMRHAVLIKPVKREGMPSSVRRMH